MAAGVISAPNGVSAITLPVHDLERTRRFYEHVFGTTCLPSSKDGKSTTDLSLEVGALVVTLRESQEERGRRGAGAGQGVVLSVPVDDVGEVYRRLRGFAEEDEA